MSEEKKNVETEVVKEEARELTEEELAQVSGGLVPGIGNEHVFAPVAKGQKYFPLE